MKSAAESPKLLDCVRQTLRARHYSRRTEEAYVAWIRRFILFHGKRHPSTMSGDEVNRFLKHLAAECNVAASTQNQALCALLFLYGPVLDQKLDWVESAIHAKRPERLPVVLTREEVKSILLEMRGTASLIAASLADLRSLCFFFYLPSLMDKLLIVLPDASVSKRTPVRVY